MTIIGTTQRSIFIATAICLALGGAGYASSVLFTGGMDLGTAAQTPLVAVSNAISSAAAIAVAIQLPSVWSGLRLPAWAVHVAAAGLAFLGAFAFALLTVVPHFGSILGDPDVFVTESAWMDALGYPKQVLLLVGLVAVAIAARIRRSFGWPATIALLLAGVVNVLLWPYAPGAILTGMALVMSVSRRSVQPDPVARQKTSGDGVEA